jgi:HEAT repeat protein
MSYYSKRINVKIRRRAAFPAALLGLFLWAGIPLQAAGLKALIVTGQNSHNWQKSSRGLEKILELKGLFRADVAISPANGEDMSGFLPDFKNYDCVILDYQGDPWPQQAKDAFVDYVASGGGVVVYHNSSNAFIDWLDYSTIIGLGGHRGPETGPYVYWEDGRVVRDPSPGISLYHGPIHAFPVMTRNADHPITRGMPPQWMHAADELYCLLRGPAENLAILATAYADPEMQGTGRHEPVLFTNTYGKGRIFHNALGHLRDDPTAMECVGFIVTLRRGAEWAATGRVTQVIPGDFPASSGVFPNDIRRWTDFRPPSLEAILKKMSPLTRLELSEAPAELRDYILSHKNTAADRTACESMLAAFLSGRASEESKAVVCRYLRLIGSEVSVPALSKLLRDPGLSDPARFALEKIPGKEADQALLAALGKSRAPIRLGIISTLRRRKTASAVDALSRLAGGRDRPQAEAALQALGQIGSPAAAEILRTFMDRDTPAAPLAAAGIIDCAEAMGTLGRTSEAAELYRHVISSGAPDPIRQTAMRGFIQSSAGRESLILEILKGGDDLFYLPAIDMVPASFSSSDDMEPLCRILPGLPDTARIQLLAALQSFPCEGVRKAAEAAAGQGPEPVTAEALKVLAVCGDVSSLPLLLEKAAAPGKVGTAARFALNNLGGSDINKALVLQVIKSTEPSIQAEALRAMGERGGAIGIPIMLSRARSSDPGVRTAAFRALRELAAPGDIPSLLNLLLLAKNDRDRTELSRTVGSAASKLPPASNRARLVIERYASVQDTEGRASLLGLLSHIGDDRSLSLLRRELKNDNPVLKEAALRALANWPHPTPRFDLISLAETADSAAHKILSLRAFIRMVEMDLHQSPQGAVRSLDEALKLSTRPEEKKLVLGVLPKFPSTDSLKLAESLVGDDSVKAEAEEAVKKIKKALNK